MRELLQAGKFAAETQRLTVLVRNNLILVGGDEIPGDDPTWQQIKANLKTTLNDNYAQNEGRKIVNGNDHITVTQFLRKLLVQATEDIVAINSLYDRKVVKRPKSEGRGIP